MCLICRIRFWQVLEASTAPVFASHSSARALHDHPRNLTDEMIKAIAEQGGIVGITWFPEYCVGGASARARGEGAHDRLEGTWIRAGRPRDAGDRNVDAKLRPRHARQVQSDDDGRPSDADRRYNRRARRPCGRADRRRPCLPSAAIMGPVRFEIPGFEDCTKFPVLTQALKDHGFPGYRRAQHSGRERLAPDGSG